MQIEETDEIVNNDRLKIFKIRLKRIIQNNKEKIKVIDEYCKKMEIIDEYFNKIKEISGFQDFEEIAKNFIENEK